MKAFVLLLFLSGCTLEQLNEVALFDYDRTDTVPSVAGKTVANLFAGAVALPVLIVAAAAQNGGMHGSISRKGVQTY